LAERFLAINDDQEKVARQLKHENDKVWKPTPKSFLKKVKFEMDYCSVCHEEL